MAAAVAHPIQAAVVAPESKSRVEHFTKLCQPNHTEREGVSGGTADTAGM